MASDPFIIRRRLQDAANILQFHRRADKEEEISNSTNNVTDLDGASQ
jgi:hypothetical protein